MSRELHSLASYVSDMIALESLMAAAFRSQAADEDYADSGAHIIVERLRATSARHLVNLTRILDAAGGNAATDFKAVSAKTTSLFAMGVSRLRKTKVAKGLRDDYGAIAFCIASYGELLCTAKALDIRSVADVAESHMRAYTKLARALIDVMPAVVATELQALDLHVEMSSIQESRRVMVSIWKDEEPQRALTGIT